MNLTRRSLLAAASIAAPSLVRAQQRPATPTKWYAVQVDENAFKVEMPGIPDHRVISDVSARGTPFVLHSYSLETGGDSYVAQTAFYPFDVDTTQPTVVLQAALDKRAQQLAGRKWAKIDWSVIDEAAAVQSFGALPSGSQLRQLSLMKEQRFVSLAFLGANVTGPDADRFFKSVKLK
jgi:hypothetical protein